MSIRKVSVNQIIQSQIPDFVRDEYPLFVQFIKQYYVSLGSQGKSLDIVENLDSYIDLDVIFSAVDFTTFSESVLCLQLHNQTSASGNLFSYSFH